MRLFAIAVAGLFSAFAAQAKDMQFPDASETPEELIALWKESNSTCRGASGGDVKVAAACLSRSVYGAALNERDRCFGKKDQVGAEMTWHKCRKDSLRFPPFKVPEQ